MNRDLARRLLLFLFTWSPAGLSVYWQPAAGILYSLCFEKQYKALVVRT